MSLEIRIRIVAVCAVLVLMYIGYPVSNWIIKKRYKRDGKIYENVILSAIFAFAISLLSVYGYDFIRMMKV